MPLTKTQKNLLVAGGLIAIGGVTAYAVAKALAKPTAPPPEEVPPTYYPAKLYFQNPNITLTQLYYAHTYAETINGWPNMCLGIWPVQYYTTPWSAAIGYIYADPQLIVVDALERGVPNVEVEVWTSPVQDDQGGELRINDALASSEHPVRVKTDANGKANMRISYQAQNCEVIARRHNCQHITPVLIPIGYVGCGGCVPAPDYIGYCNKDIETTAKIYTVIARYPGLASPQALVTAKLRSHAEIFP
jgi:hypothetical protein